MPIWLAPLLGGLATVAGSLVGRVLLALGITFVTFSGLSVGVDSLKAMVVTNMSGMGVKVAGLLAFLWVDKAITLVFSAFSALLALKMAGSDSITSMVIKK